MHTVNGVSVPNDLKHLLPRPRQTTEDVKAKLRHYIDSRPNEALTNADFQELLNTTSAMAHVNKLMKQGYITRNRVRKGKGKRFCYKWHDTPLDYEAAARKNGLVLVKDLDLPSFALKGKLDELDKLAYEWQDSLQRPINGEHLVGVLEFRKWLKLKDKEVEEVRRAKIDEHTANRRHNDVDNANAESTHEAGQ